MRKLFVVYALLCLICSCTDVSDFENRLDKLEQEVSDLKEAITVLDKACKDSKSIKSVEPLDNPSGGYVITFSDDKTIEIINGDNGEDGITPFLMVDQDGWWNVSYDGGNTFTKLMDGNGNYVFANGGIAVSVRVAVNDNGYYVFELYNESSPDTVIDSVVTPHNADKSKVIDSITQDNKSGVITIAMGDGTKYVFNKEYPVPNSIAVLKTTPLKLGEGTTACLEFRVNPSNAKFNFDVDSEDCNIELDLLGDTKSSYVVSPKNYRLSKVEQVYDEHGILKAGQYRAHITDLEVSSDYVEDVALVLTVNNSNNEQVQISSSGFNVRFAGNLLTSFAFLKDKNSGVIYDVNVKIDGNDIEIYSPLVLDVSALIATFKCNGEKVFVGDVEQVSGFTENDFTSPVTYTVVSEAGETNSYTVTVSNTGLPVVVVNTPDATTIPPKTSDWLKNTEIRIYDTNGDIDYKGTKDNIRGRGNSTWTYPKKPYAIKLDSKSEILDMPKHKRWVLLANWMDRTMMRNSVAFKIAELSGMEWTPRGKFVELVLNGVHMGNYYLCEQIKIDENRVNIYEMEDTDTEGDAITGGYLMELDVYFDEVNKFKSSIRELPYMIKEPDEDALNDAQFNYIQNYINTLEAALYDDTRFINGEYKDYLDIESFIKWWFVHELAHNGEPGHPKSSYMHKDKLNKLKSGPVWDFDWGTFRPSTNFSIKNAIYYGRLFEDPQFVQEVKKLWQTLKPQFELVIDYIESEGQRLGKSADINVSMWPISGVVNGDETLSYTEAVARMKSAYSQRVQWLDAQINNF